MPDLPVHDGRHRVAIENVRPSVDDGRFAVKRIVGQQVAVSADAFADGHGIVQVALLWRATTQSGWHELPMTSPGNDLWQATFEPGRAGRYEYMIEAWVDSFATWQHDFAKRLEVGQPIATDMMIGAGLVAQAVVRAEGDDVARLRHWQDVLSGGQNRLSEYSAGSGELTALMQRYSDRSVATRCARPYPLVVDPAKAGFSTWYELFPRSCAKEAGTHGTFVDCIAWLPRIAEMGFDVVYLPPIHPIGTKFRKGRNNAPTAAPDDVGCPWAIGASDGGHTAIHSRLGTLADFQRLVAAALELGIDIALDIAFQCSPDHPYAKAHPDWFRKRPDGTIQYAENPPKKYEDIYPFDFESEQWRSLWRELTEVFLHWAEQGIRVFRVDNPHTKPFAFWEYLIGEVKARFPETIFLSEAFTRPKVMYRLAKLGFTQSYTYFTWRATKEELTEYFTQLADPQLREYFRPHLWPNTPDILPAYLHGGCRAAYVGRLVLAATLGANYGIYGPPFETLEGTPREAGSEEYLDSEKYQLQTWNFDRSDDLQGVLTSVNRARRENPALQSDAGLQFHPTDNQQLLCYSKHSADRSNWVLVVVNLDFYQEQHGYIEVPLAEVGIGEQETYRVHDLLTDAVYTWQGARNFVELDPAKTVAHVLRVLPRE